MSEFYLIALMASIIFTRGNVTPDEAVELAHQLLEAEISWQFAKPPEKADKP